VAVQVGVFVALGTAVYVIVRVAVLVALGMGVKVSLAVAVAVAVGATNSESSFDGGLSVPLSCQAVTAKTLVMPAERLVTR
jgi:hypothetical protein